MLLKCSFVLCAVLFSILCSKVNSGYSPIYVSKPRADPNPVDEDWWKNGVFYQIYPRSFKEDGRTKGIGNLQGITNKLKQLKDTGITAIWLSQIYKTPGTEHGEDISNFEDIHADYGDLADFDKFILEAKNHKIKVILDFVLNHSGKKHPWFIRSEAKNEEFKDFYVWRNGTDGRKQPPNNWLSVHGDSAWEWSEIRKEFYLHQFGIEQPDLNYANPKVIEEIKKVMKIWLDKKIDGFRLDAVPFLFEDDQFRNEPPSNNPTAEAYEHESLSHIYTMDQNKTFDLIYELREFIDQYTAENKDETAKILMSEAYTSINNTMRYYGTTEKKGVHIPFNFQLIHHDKDSNATQIVASINEWLSKMPKEQIANWVIGNHDKHRAATRFGPELVDNMNILIASLPGVAITYNGEEIGQENGNVSFIQCKDPIGCRAGAAHFHNVSRDFERTPYHWDDTSYAGFTDFAAEDTWLPVSDKYKNTNLENQKGTANSHYKIYTNILKLRQSQAFKSKIVKVEALPNNVIKITRIGESVKDNNYIVLINMGGEKVSVKASDNDRELYEVIFTTDNSINEKDKIWEKDLSIAAYKTIALKVISKSGITYDWWKNAVIYQIYVRSFKDEIDNDGIGDLKGIIKKIDYLADLGVNVICLSSIYKSDEKKDLGYDISSFEEIDEDYGTMDDFKLLLSVAENKEIKVIMDFVPNHSSKNHEWFQDPLTKEYYVWKTATTVDPPNNWLSVFHGKAWTKSSATSQEYYLHQFDSSQPDLNYTNPKVRNEMEKLLKFWLDIGVDGFRMTAIPHLFEAETLPNEPLSNDPEAKEDSWNSLRHVYTSNLPPTFDLIYDWRHFLDIYTAEHGGKERIMIAEAYTDIQNTMYYYGNKNKEGAHLTLNFQLIEKVNGTSNANDFAAKINEWIDLIPKGFTSNWVLGNHDKRRVATRFGPKNVDGFNMLTAILPGVMVTYNGEEIGQEDTILDLKNCDGDPVFCYEDGQTEGLEELCELRRDRQRTPFHWDSSLHAGFTKRKEGPWLPVSPKYSKNNLKMQTNRTDSHYELYKRLLKLRQQPAFVDGSLKVKAITDYVLISLRYHTENESYFHIFNLGDNVESFNLKTAFNESTPFLKVVETNDHKKFPTGTLLNAESVTLQGHQSVIAVFTTKTMPGSATINVISSFVLVLSILINTINFN